MDLTIYDDKLKKAAEVAYSKGGKLVSTVWTKGNDKYEFKCKEDHIWWATLGQVIGTVKKGGGSWCKICFNNGRKFNINDVAKIINDKGGKIITDTTNLKGNGNTIWLEIECKQGHIFSSRISNIKKGTFCKICKHAESLKTEQWKEKSQQTKDNFISIIKILIEKKNGKFIERKETGTKGRLRNFIICKNGHLFSKTTSDLKNGEWCSHKSCKKINYYYNLSLCTTSDNFNLYQNNYYLSIINDSLKYNEIYDNYCKLSNKYSNEITALKEKSTSRCNEIKKYLSNSNYIPLDFSKSEFFNIKFRKHTLETAKEIGKNNNFECLTTEYLGPAVKLELKCGNNHIFYRSMNELNSERFCDQCPKDNYYSIEAIQKIVGDKGGKILSTEFKLVTDIYKWECSEGHTWESPAHNILYHNSWCPPCSVYGDRWTIKDMQEIAKNKGGECLSTKYINTKTELKWKCKKGHTWDTKPCNIIEGCWCPDCGSNASYGEKVMEQIVNKIFNNKFEKIRPDWLRNSITKSPMELDLYNDELKIAFEYQGKQHYQFIKYFHREESKFIEQQKRDLEKKELCKKNNVLLIDIPYTLKFEDIQKYIIDECEKNSINVPNYKPIDINKLDIY